jgi:hypothetical protein
MQRHAGYMQVAEKVVVLRPGLSVCTDGLKPIKTKHQSTWVLWVAGQSYRSVAVIWLRQTNAVVKRERYDRRAPRC